MSLNVKVLIAALSISGLTHADVPEALLKIKEGLWEMKMTMSLEGMPKLPAGVLEKMPQAQRERMAKLMGASHEPTVMKECITKEKLAKYKAFNSKHDNCTHHVIKALSNRYEANFVCNMKNMKTTGDMVVEAIDTEHSRGSVKTKSEHEGKAMGANMTFESRYLGPSCGDVK